MAKWENSYYSFDADDDGGGGTTVNTTSIYNDGLSSTESYLIDDDGNAYNYNNTDTAVAEDHNSSESGITTSDDYSSCNDDNTASDEYSYWDDNTSDSFTSWESDNTVSNEFDYSEADDLMPDSYSSWQEDYYTETNFSEESLAVPNGSTITQETEPVEVMSNVDTETVNENQMGLHENTPAGQGDISEEALIPAETAEGCLNSNTNDSAALVQENTGTSGNIAHILDTPQVMGNPTIKTENSIEKKATDSLNPNTEKDKEQINFKSESLKNETAGKTNNIGPKPLLPSERARMALFNKRNSSEDDFYNNVTGGTKRDILDKYNAKKPSSLVVASDIKGQDVTFDDFNVDGMDISIKREHDGYGNKFDSVRTIETVKLANGQVVKCNIQDMVGANAESKAFADEHKGMTLPDGKYYFTAKKLTKQSDGTYNSDCFQNTLRLQTKDSNIPKNIRDDINSKYYLFHATEYKKGFIPKKGNRIWINPWSAGCISSITGGQSTHDDFMNMLTGITPENINVTITSKRHVDI